MWRSVQRCASPRPARASTAKRILPFRNTDMTNQFDLTDDQREIQDLARKFTADRITPFAAEWDKKHHYPVDVWKAVGELGFGAIYVSEESGGIGPGGLQAGM